MPILTANNLHKTYRLGRVDVPVLRGIDLTIEHGEWVAVLGASGSGKSTLLHLLGGLDRPDRTAKHGQITFDGRALDTFSQAARNRYRRRSIGFVFQFYHLLPELTVLENVAIAAMVSRGATGYTRHRRGITGESRRLLEGFGLGHRLRHRPAQLSGGERQRVAIARALVNMPAILLADEPTGNLDRQTGDTILDALSELRRERKQTIIMVTHDTDVSSRADRTIHLVDGRAVPDRE